MSHPRPYAAARPALLLVAFCLLILVSGCAASDDAAPDVLDDRLQLTLAAADPQIVTPIGLAVDDEDRLYVLESHTHVPPSDYEGPGSDRVKVFETRGDELQEIGVFAEGFEDGMNLAFGPDGVLYVVAAKAVWAFHDRDGDGVSDDRTRVLELNPPESVYDHAALMGIAFSSDGWMYVSRGNVGGAEWRITGTDGSWVDGYGDGGNIVRARPDGSDVQEVATGFWNPFYLFTDRAGRLLATDNDPDSRGPNRLLHIIQGGDYGYEALYGGSGIHPYLAWNGELPGTLPYAAGLGEAPTGCIEPDAASMPTGYERSLLCAIWEESAIVRVRLSPRGASIQGEVEPLIEGDAAFRPVVMAATSDGTIYVTDWVVRAYPNHGNGRIWRLKALETTDADPTEEPATGRLDAIYAAEGADAFPRLRTALISPDPFVRTAAVSVLTRPDYRGHVVDATRDSSAAVRLGALLALQRAKHRPAEPIARRLLTDPDPDVRRMALIWIGKAGMTALKPDLERAARDGRISADHFDTYLATLRHLQPAFVAAYRDRTADEADRIERSLPQGLVADFAADTSRPAALRAAALAYLDDPDEHVDLLEDLTRSDHAVLRRNAVTMLARTHGPGRTRHLLEIAETDANPSSLRAEALLGLTGSEVEARRIVPLLESAGEAVRVEAARLLRTLDLDDALRRDLEAVYPTLPPDGRVAGQLSFILDEDRHERPERIEAWQAAAASGGDPEFGRRVFFWPRAQCAQCHSVDHIGGDVGPDLSSVGASKSRAQLVTALVDPSREVAPDWQTWFVIDSTGTQHVGRQIDVGGTSVELYTVDGSFTAYERPRAWGVLDRSLMPDGLPFVLSVHDFRDLVAFLKAND